MSTLESDVGEFHYWWTHKTLCTAGPGFEPGALALLPGCGFQVFIVLILRDALRGIKPPTKTSQSWLSGVGRWFWLALGEGLSLVFAPDFGVKTSPSLPAEWLGL